MKNVPLIRKNGLNPGGEFVDIPGFQAGSLLTYLDSTRGVKTSARNPGRKFCSAARFHENCTTKQKNYLNQGGEFVEPLPGIQA